MATRHFTRGQWFALAVAYVFTLTYVISLQSVPPLVHLLRKEIPLDYSQVGSLMGVFSLPGVLIAIPGGIWADRHNIRVIGTISLAMVVLGNTTAAFAQNYWWLIAGRLVTGVGAMMLAILGPQILTRLFDKGKIGFVMGIFNTAVPVGVLLSMNTLGLLGESLGWRNTLFACNGVAIVAYLLFRPLSSAPQAVEASESPDAATSPRREIGVGIVLLASIWLLFNAACLSFLTFGMDLIAGIGKGLGASHFLVSSIMLGALVLSPLIGYLIDRFNYRYFYIVTAGILMAASFLLLTRTDAPAPLIVLLSIAVGLVPVSVFTLVLNVVGARHIGLGYGVLNTFLNVGNSLGPYVTGRTIDAAGFPEAGFYAMATYSGLMALVVFLMWRKQFKVRVAEPQPRRADSLAS